MRISNFPKALLRNLTIFSLAVVLILYWGAAQAETVKVKPSAGLTVEVVAGAFTGAKRKGFVRAGQEVEVLIRSGLWTKIKAPKVTGWVLNAQLQLPKLQYVVTAAPAAKGIIKGSFPQKPEMDLPFGTVVDLTERFGAAAEVRGIGRNVVIASDDIQQCVTSYANVQSVQFCLNRQGYDVGGIDNKMGPKTQAAIDAALQRHVSAPGHLSLACIKQVVCAPALNPEISTPPKSAAREAEYLKALDRALASRALRRRWAASSAAFAAGKCEALANFPEVERNGLSVTECEDIRTQKHQSKQAKTYFEARNCAALAKIPATAQGEYTQDKCAKLKQTEQNNALFARAMSQLDCDGAAQIAQTLSGLSGQVAECRKDLQRTNDAADFAEAVAQNDCARIETLQSRIGKKGAAAQCQFNLAMASESPRKMYLAAQKYDRSDDQARAKLLYEAVTEKFADDDLVLRASERLIVMNDRDNSARDRKALELEMAQLRQQTAAAQQQLQQARAAQVAAVTPDYPGGFRPGDAAVICMQSNNHIPVTVVRNPSGSRMEIRPQRDFYTGNNFVPTEYYRGRNYFFERSAIAHSRSGCR